MALVYQHQEPSVVRGTIGTFRLISIVASLAALALVGEFTTAQLQLGLILVPAAILGFLASTKLIGRVDRRGIRPFLLGLSFSAALGVLIRGLLG